MKSVRKTARGLLIFIPVSVRSGSAHRWCWPRMCQRKCSFQLHLFNSTGNVALKWVKLTFLAFYLKCLITSPAHTSKSHSALWELIKEKPSGPHRQDLRRSSFSDLSSSPPDRLLLARGPSWSHCSELFLVSVSTVPPLLRQFSWPTFDASPPLLSHLRLHTYPGCFPPLGLPLLALRLAPCEALARWRHAPPPLQRWMDQAAFWSTPKTAQHGAAPHGTDIPLETEE